MINIYDHFSTCNIFILPGSRLDHPSSTSNKVASNNNKILLKKIADCGIDDPSRTSWRFEKSNNVKSNFCPSSRFFIRGTSRFLEIGNVPLITTLPLS
jgi:hypothetical protein